MEPPNIVIMTNNELEWAHVTLDRWHIWDLQPNGEMNQREITPGDVPPVIYEVSSRDTRQMYKEKKTLDQIQKAQNNKKRLSEFEFIPSKRGKFIENVWQEQPLSFNEKDECVLFT